MTTGLASSSDQTLVTKANFDGRTTPLEKFTASGRTIDQLLQQASELLDLNKYSEAIAVLDLILELQPNSFLAWHWRGNSLATLGQYKNAIASYDKALKIKPNYLLALLERQVLLLFLLISWIVR